MKSTETKDRRALEMLERLAASLDAERLARQIDEPIDQATREFVCPSEAIRSQHQLLDILAAFLRHLHTRAFPNGRRPTLSQARDEVMALLEQAPPPSGGYYEALLEATDSSEEGLGEVLIRVAELVKARQRSARLRWAAASHIESVDWRMKCRMAAILLERCRPYLSGRVTECRPEQMADQILDLLAIDLATRH